MIKIDFKKILKLSKKPDIFTRTDDEFWNDPYISQKMLEAHLNPGLDAASRSFKTIDRSVKWLTEKILPEPDNSTKILDLGCGPGLYSTGLARAGYMITGIDFSERSISYAKKQAEAENLEIKYLYQNYLTIDYRKEFDVIMLIYCDLGALTDEERDILLDKIYRALKPGGLFIFDVFTDKNREDSSIGRSWEVTEKGFWKSEPYIALTETLLYPENDTFLDQTIVMTADKEVNLYRIYDHFYTRKTISELLDRHGFKDHNYYANLQGNSYNRDSNTIALITTK